MLPNLSSARFPLSGRVVKIAKDQDGSRFIQQRLAIANKSEIQMVFDEAMLGIEGENLDETHQIIIIFCCLT